MNERKQMLPITEIGSDGIPITNTYKLYLEQCENFKKMAYLYKKDNLFLKNSVSHTNKFGYETSEDFERQVLKERSNQLESYKKAFNITSFDDDPNSMFTNFKAKSKRIRIIRDLSEPKDYKFSENFDKGQCCWFSRYCTLSRFIQAVRIVIIQNRLKRVLKIFRRLTPKKVAELESDEDIEMKNKEIKSASDNVEKIGEDNPL